MIIWHKKNDELQKIHEITIKKIIGLQMKLDRLTVHKSKEVDGPDNPKYDEQI